MPFDPTSSSSSSPVEALEPIITRITEVATPLNIGYALIGSVAAMQLYKSYKTRGTISVITEGHSGFIRSYFSANTFLQNAKGTLTDCYTKYDKATFRVPAMEQWTTIINKPELIEEIRKAPADRFSFAAAATEAMSTKYTLGRITEDHDYGTDVIRSQLTRSLTTNFEDVCDEIALTFQEYVPLPKDTNEWVAFPALATMLDIVSRASNRIFVGTPLCRDREWVKLCVQYTMDVAGKFQSLRKVPNFLRPIVGKYILITDNCVPRALSKLKPILDERIEKCDTMGADWPDKPNDMITWLIEAAPHEEAHDVAELTRRILGVNFSAIHTTTMTFVHALFHLAAEPKYAAIIRDEVEPIIKDEGWTKDAMAKMVKLDSFMKESQRLNGINLTSLLRKAMKDTVLSDGTFIPRGSLISANMTAIHRDPAIYPSPDEFRPWRFAEMQDQSQEGALRNSATNTAADYLTFGHGRYACPGRFFAMNEMKAMMAYVVMNYDVRTEAEGVRPPNMYPTTVVVPNPMAKVLFRRRSRA